MDATVQGMLESSCPRAEDTGGGAEPLPTQRSYTGIVVAVVLLLATIGGFLLGR